VCLAVPRGLPPLTGLSAGDDLNLCIDKDTDPLLLVITATDRDNFGAETWLAWDDAWKTGDRIPAWKILRVQDGWVEVGPRQLQVRLFNSASEARRDPSMGS
jgi:hypothetical protein